MSEGITLGAIDAGSNAIRMSVGRATGPGDFVALESERLPVRLGHRAFTHGELDGPTIEAAVLAFARFRRVFDRHGVTRFRAVATSAVRNAGNREDLIDRLHREVDIELEVIDGEEEARLVRQAVLRALGPSACPSIICDLGGGSLEITQRTRDEWVTSSMRIGTVRLMETFGLKGAISAEEAQLIRRYVASLIRAAVTSVQPDETVTQAIACGGNAEALAALLGQVDKSGTPCFKVSSLEDELVELLPLELAERMSEYELRKDRSEVIGIAGLVFAEVGRHLGLKRFVAPGVGIRDGILLDLASESAAGLPSSREPAVLAAARAFAARMAHSGGHGEQVRWLARTLFDELRSIHELPKRLGLVLEIAALLHDIGEVVHRRSHHKHAEYMILNGRIPGLEDPDRQMVAAVARAHRKSPPDIERHQTFASLSPEQQEQVRAMVALLRVADALDSDHLQGIVSLHVEIKNKKVRLTCGVSANGSAPAATAFKLFRTNLFEEQFARKVVVEVVQATSKHRKKPAVSE